MVQQASLVQKALKAFKVFQVLKEISEPRVLKALKDK